MLQHHQLVTAYSALENVLLPMLDGTGQASAAMHARARALIERVGLASCLHRRAGLLDIAQQQRVAVARALALAPPLLLADEPTGNLDSTGAAALVELLLDLSREQSTTVLLVSTNASLASGRSRTLHLVGGRVDG